MAKKRYGSEESWPRLANKDLNAQAQRARSLGWTAESKESHGGFVITCPGDQCKVRFDSTPKDPTRKAKQADRAIRLCSHSSGHRETLQKAIEALDRAERLIQAVEELLKANDLERQAVEEQAEVLLDEAVKHEQRARDILLRIYGADQPEMSIKRNLGRALTALKNARAAVGPKYKEKPPHPEIRAAWERYEALRCRLKALEDQARDSKR